jgi:hypothetical protein
MVDDDEHDISPYQVVTPYQPGPKEIIEIITKKDDTKFPWWKLILGVALGLGVIVLAAVSYYAFFLNQDKSQLEMELTKAAEQQTVAALVQTNQPKATIVQPTAAPTKAPLVIVFTATPLPDTSTPPATIAPAPTLTQLPQPAILFADNFDQGLSKAWGIVSGNPVVVNGELTSDNNTWLKIGDNSWTDYMVQFNVQTANCWYNDNWNAIGVRIQDTGNMIAYKWASCESEWNIVKNGNWSTVPNSHSEYGGNGNAQTTITITIQGGQFAVDVNGTRVSSFFNSDYKQGGVALRVGAKTQIDDFKIITIQK